MAPPTIDPARRPAWRRTASFLLPGLLGSAAIALVLLGALRYPSLVARLYPQPPRVAADIEIRFEWPGIRQPPTVPASEAAVCDDEAVIGISAGGRNRAYLVRALAQDRTTHIVNDVVGGVPVTVTHCNIYRCSRAFSGGPPDEPLDLSQGGLRAGGMVLKSGGYAYRQDSATALDPGSPPFPYSFYPGEETTWGEWRGAHPDTDVYGGPVSPTASPQVPPVRPVSVASATGDFADPIPWLCVAALSGLPLLGTLPALLASALLRRFVRARSKFSAGAE
ncbi:MAG TPA: DUF3179 domain-containing (seleno)protein [Gemmataceae bacterium]|nr:DUF3179 domain-containing (seleno)protein [Gemmataceae bacterium]